jgi:hypothetical protein
MDFSQLFQVSEATVSAFRVEPVGDAHLDHTGLMTGEVVPAEPIVFRHYMGGAAPKDLIATGYPGLVLLSDRVLSCLREHGFTGWSTFPVRVEGKKRVMVEGYHGFVVTGRCGPFDTSRSQLVTKDPLVPGGRSYQMKRGLYFDPATWDGSDIFSPPKTAYWIVTDRVREALQKAKFTNLKVERLSEYEFYP